MGMLLLLREVSKSWAIGVAALGEQSFDRRLRAMRGVAIEPEKIMVAIRRRDLTPRRVKAQRSHNGAATLVRVVNMNEIARQKLLRVFG
jgi:hypothetical protein